jgi:L-phenylalanine/L-methionine N-acetyltransferase
MAMARVLRWCAHPSRKVFTHGGLPGMGVHPDFRERGIGSQLLRKALAHGRRIGLERVELEVFASNMAGKKLYERAGFKVEGT